MCKILVFPIYEIGNFTSDTQPGSNLVDRSQEASIYDIELDFRGRQRVNRSEAKAAVVIAQFGL